MIIILLFDPMRTKRLLKRATPSTLLLLLLLINQMQTRQLQIERVSFNNTTKSNSEFLIGYDNSTNNKFWILREIKSSEPINNQEINGTSRIDSDEILSGELESWSMENHLVCCISIVNTIICVVGICGNFIVILVILKYTKCVTVNDILILNLAFADLMFVTGLVFLIITMHSEIWIFGNAMCKVSVQTLQKSSDLGKNKFIFDY